MKTARITIAVCMVLLLGLPFIFRGEASSYPDGTRRLIIITPHNEQIRHEFARGFDLWHEATYGERVEVVYNVPGGTSEIRKMLQSQFEARLKSGEAPGGEADLVFGGGSYEYNEFRKGVEVDGQVVPITEQVTFDQAWLDEMYGENLIGDSTLYEPEGYWFGVAVSGFGIVYNRDALRRIHGTDDAASVAPRSWTDLCDPALYGWVALVNPAQSGSITTAFEAIFKNRGWEDGWQILRRSAANARYFSARSLKPPTDVSQGNAAVGVCIDFYGRFESQAMLEHTGRDRVGYIDPVGETMIDPDPIAMLRNAPDPELARRFIEFCLSDSGQALWQFRRDDDGDDGLGPERFELRRLPIRRSVYERFMPRLIDQVDPYEIARPATHPNPAFRSFISPMFAAMAMDRHDSLRHAWLAITSHPAYPDGGGLVAADDVDDPTLREMLRLFDAMPEVTGPDGTVYPLSDQGSLADVKAGWLRGKWKDSGLWHTESAPQDALRRQFGRFFEGNYERILRLAEEGPGPHG